MPSETQLGVGWYEVLKPVFSTDWWKELHRKVWEAMPNIQPQPKDIFRAFRETPFNTVKVILYAQDPYPTNYADGLAFSSGNGHLPKSLEYIYRELQFEYGIRPTTYSLEGWAHQGVLLINSALTVGAGNANSHANFGWDKFILEVFHQLDKAPDLDPVFVAWGGSAKKLISQANLNPSTPVITGNHPIAESYSEGRIKFVGGNYFKRINILLEEQGKEPIRWV